MSELLNKVCIVQWVMNTVEKMLAQDRQDPQTWNSNWLRSYEELGGTSRASGAKGCPRAAAYGLWRMGLIAGGGVPRSELTIQQVEEKYTRNAAYVAIAASRISKQGNLEARDLWDIVRAEYREQTGREPADSEQGEIRLVVALSRAGHMQS
jgi:hypothetical protein